MLLSHRAKDLFHRRALPGTKIDSSKSHIYFWSSPYLPVEDVIRARQTEYYQALANSDKAGNSSDFIEFTLDALRVALREIPATDQVGDPVSDQVASLLRRLGTRTLTARECMTKLGLSHRHNFRKNYLQPALDAGLVERTIPDKPRSRLQKYRRTRHA